MDRKVKIMYAQTFIPLCIRNWTKNNSSYMYIIQVNFVVEFVH